MAIQWLWRLLQTVAGIWLLASLAFLLSHAGPVQSTDLLLRDASDLSTSARSTAEQQRAMRRAAQQRLGLGQPVFYLSWQSASPATAAHWHWNGFYNQYHTWLLQLLRGNLGQSLRTGEAVSTRLREALGYTFPLVAVTLLVTLLLAWHLAQRLAARPWWRHPVQLALTALQALPLFGIALALLLLLANPEVMSLFPAYGLGQLSPADDGWAAWLTTYAYHVALPSVSLLLSVLPAITLQLEAALCNELNQPYAATAFAKGLSRAQVIRRHALRNALLPLITQITDVLPTLVAGTLVVEMVFAVPGMGRLLVHAAATRDYPVIIAGILLLGAMRLFALALADVLTGWTDPRIQ